MSFRSVLVICLFVLTGATTVSGQTGMFLTYNCPRNTKNARQVVVEKTSVCLAEKPLVTSDEIESISPITEYPGMLEFYMVLTEKSFERLKQAYNISPVIVYLVDGQLLFTLETKTNTLTSRRISVQTTQDFLTFRIQHSILKQKIGQED